MNITQIVLLKRKKIPGFSAALSLKIPVKGIFFSIYVEDPRRVFLRYTQFLTVSHHPPPYQNVKDDHIRIISLNNNTKKYIL